MLAEDEADAPAAPRRPATCGRGAAMEEAADRTLALALALALDSAAEAGAAGRLPACGDDGGGGGSDEGAARVELGVRDRKARPLRLHDPDRLLEVLQVELGRGEARLELLEVGTRGRA